MEENGGGVRQKIQWLAPYDWVIVAYLVVGTVLSFAFDFKIEYRVFLDFTYDMAFLSMVASFLAIVLLATAWQEYKLGHDEKPFGSSWRKNVLPRYVSAQSIYDLIRVLLLLKLVLTIYCCIKQAIPRINPTLYDEALRQADTAFHLGVDPVLASVHAVQSAFMQRAIDVFYVAWYTVKPIVLALFVIVPDRSLHNRFFGAYFALWMVGGLIAVALPSLGPIYVTPEWFESIDKPFATKLQAQLWTHYQQLIHSPEGYQAYVYEGIAAFPSLHVAAVALFTCFLFHLNRVAGIAMLIFTLITQFGSAFLGWHYAIDGYFGIILAYGLYRVSGWKKKTS